MPTEPIHVYVNHQTGSAAPGDTIIANGRLATVTRVVIEPPGDHTGPIVPTMYAVNIETDNGATRYAGGTDAWIGADLRAHWER